MPRDININQNSLLNNPESLIKNQKSYKILAMYDGNILYKRTVINQIANSIKWIILYADDEDILTFLKYVFPFERLPKKAGKYEDLRVRFIEVLFRYIQYYVNYKTDDILYLQQYLHLSKILFNPNQYLFTPFPEYCVKCLNPMLLHLYALYVNYKCYQMFVDEDYKKFKVLFNLAKYFVKDMSTKTSKNSSRTKLLKLIIQNYKKNNFYYSFSNDKLIKIKIINRNQQSMDKETGKVKNEIVPSYEFKTYKLTDDLKKNKTIIKGEKSGLTTELHQILFRKYLREATTEALTAPQLKSLFSSITFTNVKKFHEEITEFLSQKRRSKKTQPVTDKNLEKLREKGRTLLMLLQELQTKTDPDDEDDTVTTILNHDFTREFFTVSPNENFSDMDEFKETKKMKLNETIDIFENAMKSDEFIYKELLAIIAKIKPEINKCFKI